MENAELGISSIASTVGFHGWHDGTTVVLPNASNVSDRCAKCYGSTASTIMCSLAYVPALWYLTLFLGVLIGAIIIAIVTQRGRVTVGLCTAHAHSRLRLRRFALLLLTPWPVAFIAFANVFPESGLILMGVAVVASVVALGLWNHAAPVRAKKIEAGYVWLDGFGADFIASCPRLPQGAG